MLSGRQALGIRYAALLSVIAITISASAGTSGSVSSGTVVGTVEVVEGRAVLPQMGAEVVFLGSGGKEYKARVDDYGRYKVSLPAPAVYRATVWLAACQLSRAAFHLKSGEKLEFQLVGVNCPGWTVSGPGLGGNIPLQTNRVLLPPEVPPFCVFPDDLPVWYREKRFAADPVSHRPEIVLSFGRCEQSPKGITYLGVDPSQFPGPPLQASKGSLVLPVAITTETFTIRADRVKWAGKGVTFYASGNVIVEDGRGHVTHAESATLSFANGHPVIKTQN